MKITKVFIFAIITLHYCGTCLSGGQLRVGFYAQKCPSAESIVRSVVEEASRADTRTPPFLLRLFFHDCFGKGCDGSILIDGQNSEKGAFQHQGVQGFDVIIRAKELVEAQCPGVVSCADIVALAARDSVVLAGGPGFEVETGRFDGKISTPSLAAGLPEVDDSIDTLMSKFGSIGLSHKDLVVLTGGGHSIGTTACFFMTKRLYDFTGAHDSDPAINPNFLSFLKSQCPENGNVNARMPLDTSTSDTFDDRCFKNIRDGSATLASDARLNDNAATREVVNSYLGKDRPNFGRDFAMAMVKLGRVGVKDRSQGEIRRVCNAFNNK